MKIAFYIIVLSVPIWMTGCSETHLEKAGSSAQKSHEQFKRKINGADLEMPNKELCATSFEQLSSMNVSWVGVIPYGYTRKNDSKVNYDHPHQWWGEQSKGVIKTIQLAREKRFKIMLKPHVWISGEGWPGEFTCDTEREWENWEQSYYDYIMRFATIAASFDVEIFCVGTEYRIAVRERVDFWNDLISDVREVYDGKITYAANWDNYANVAFWNKLDVVGIDAYFPITNTKHPQSKALKSGFKKLARRLHAFSDSCHRQILFTEYGFRSLDYSTSGYYKYQVEELSTNTELQAEAYRAFLSTFWNKEWITGGFFWKYQFKSRSALGGLENNNYTPQYKPAQKVLSNHYNRGK